MPSKQPLLVEYDLEFLEMKLEELKQYIINNPLDKLEDRIRLKETKTGGILPIVIANKEAQRKDLTQALKDYAEILRTIKSFRETEAIKKDSVRGNQGLSPFEDGTL